jgi:hypothetical protein
MDWKALFLTLRLALVVCTTELIIGIPIAVWLSFTRWRWKFFCRIHRCAATRVTANRTRFLCAGRARLEQPNWPSL